MADEIVNLENTGEIDLPKLDLKPYIGKKSIIKYVTEHQGQHGYYVKFTSDIIDVIKRDNAEDIELTASRIFGLQEDKDKKIGWGAETKLGVFLKENGVKH